MSKRAFRIIICISVIAILLMSTVFASGVKKNIEVLFNSVNLTVNGNKVSADTIVYNGTTYVPLRATADMLGKEVGWDQKTNTASVNDKIIKGVITVDQISYELDIQEPDSIGNVYVNATYKNNTKYPITGISLTILLKDKNEKTYLLTYDTVMPGETSPIFKTFGPKTQKLEDIEVLKVEIRAENTNGKTITVDYDTKLNKYTYSEY